MKILYLLLFTFLITSCEGELVDIPENPCDKVPKDFKISHFFNIVDSLGNPSQEYEKLSLIATDSLWNPRYLSNGELHADIKSHIFIFRDEDSEGNLLYLRFLFGILTYEYKDYAEGYYLLKIDDSTYKRIKAHYDQPCYSTILSKVYIDDVEINVGNQIIEIEY